MGSRWTEEEDAILLEVYPEIPKKDILEMLSTREWGNISKRASDRGIRRVYQEERSYLYGKTENFFSVLSPISCYWAGFIAADGNVHKNRNTISIELSQKDRSHLDRFILDTKYEGHARNYSRMRFEKEFLSSRLEITSREWKSALEKYFSITENKSLSLNPPMLQNNEHIASFICGLVDGDGSISKTKNNKLVLSLYGTRKVLEWVKEFFDKNFPYKRISSICANRNIFQYTLSEKRLIDFYTVVRRYSLPLLRRKWEKCYEYT